MLIVGGLFDAEDCFGAWNLYKAIEKKKRFSAFPWQLATIVRVGRLFPGWLYDKIAGNTNYREQKE